jgi:glycosyltransferase involved in cell wall biosynthesis
MSLQFSVVVSVYELDSPIFFRQALESVLNQTLLPKEVVIVVDGIIDKELDSVICFYEKERIFRVERLPKNIGLGPSRHKAILSTTTQIIAVMDADDICVSDRFESQISAINSMNVDVVGGVIAEFEHTIDIIDRIRDVPCSHNEIVDRGRFISPINHVTIMFRKEAYFLTKGYSGFRKLEDYDLYHNMINSGLKLLNLSKVLVYVRVSNEQYIRRHGLMYLLEEIKLHYDMYKTGYINLLILFFNIIVRVPTRLMPVTLLRMVVKIFLRSKYTESNKKWLIPAKTCSRKTFAVIATTPKMVHSCLVNHINKFSEFYDVTVISNYHGQKDILDVLSSKIRMNSIPIAREPSLIQDFKTILLLMIFFYKVKCQVVYSISPKGGFLGMLAAWIMRVPVRIHTFTGQVWVNKKGLTRWMLKSIDKIITFFAVIVIVDGRSQYDFLVENNVVSSKKALVIENGSISGVDAEHFYPNPIVRQKLRAENGTHNSSVIFLFVGRISRDKGVFELVRAFTSIYNKIGHAALWFVGDDEEDLQEELELLTSGHQCTVEFFPYTKSPAKYMQAADVFCLPSHREGFAKTIIESAACGIPSVGSRIYGITDTIVDGETGILFEKDDVHGLASAMLALANNCSLRMEMGSLAKSNVLEKYNLNRITDELMLIIKNLLDQEA